jgi:hypothetical protein
MSLGEKMRGAGSGDAPATAAEAQDQPAAVNPPGEADAKPSETPAQDASAVDRLTSRMMSAERLAGAFEIGAGIVEARIFNYSEPNYADNVGHLAIEVADAVIKAAEK